MTTVEYPPRPVPEPIVGSLLDGVATVVDSNNFAWFGTGEGLFNSYDSLTFGHSPVFPCTTQPTKDFDQTATWVSGFRFGAYGGTTCKSVGYDMAEAEAQVRKAFESGESIAVEAAFMATRFEVAAGEDVVSGVKKWDDPVDITPGSGAVKPKVGLALLEAWMGPRYTGLPTLHVPTVVLSLVMGPDGVVVRDKMLRTQLGSKVVNGVGYDEPNTGPDGSDAPAGEKWLYATGEVLVIRSPDIVRQAMDRSTNDVFTLAERAYIGSAAGPTAAVRVQVS